MRDAIVVDLHAATSTLPELLELALSGSKVIITQHGVPAAMLLPVQQDRMPPRAGVLEGHIKIAEEFDAPLPDALIATFEGR